MAHAAMVEVAHVPPPDRFQILTGHSPENLIYDASYLGIARSDDIVMIQIVLNQRPTNAKLALYKAIADRLASDPRRQA